MEEHAATDSRAKELIAYTYLHAFANDDTLDDHELEFLKKLVLKDGVIDDDEARVIHRLLDHLAGHAISPKVAHTIDTFRTLFPREKYLSS
jgi:hypothetical protein